MIVCEYFYSLQGEGTTTGVPAVFLRLAGCNLMCGGNGTQRDKKLYNGATWRCDTIEVWMHGVSKQNEELAIDMQASCGAITRLREGAHLVITGGEPLIQQESIVDFLVFLEKEYNLKPFIEIETNATIQPIPTLASRVGQWNTSPKLSNSGANGRIEPEVLKWFAAQPNTMSKMVISNKQDWDEIMNDYITKELINKNQIVLMPAAGSREELLINNKIVAEIAIYHGVRMCTRLHVEIWDKLTGV